MFSPTFYNSASERTIALATLKLDEFRRKGAKQAELEQFARALETLYERGGVDSLNKYAPQILQEDLIPADSGYAVSNGVMYPTGRRGL